MVRSDVSASKQGSLGPCAAASSSHDVIVSHHVRDENAIGMFGDLEASQACKRETRRALCLGYIFIQESMENHAIKRCASNANQPTATSVRVCQIWNQQD